MADRAPTPNNTAQPATSWEIARLYGALKAQAEWDQVQAFVAKWGDERQTTCLIVTSEENYNDEYYENEQHVVSGMTFDYDKPAWADILDGITDRDMLSYDQSDVWDGRLNDCTAMANYFADAGRLPLGTFDLTRPPPPVTATIYLVRPERQEPSA